MMITTNNSFGKISIGSKAIEKVTSESCANCYGVSKVKKAIISSYDGVDIMIDLYINLKYGVSISAVIESIKSSVKYDVEKFTGMFISIVSVHIIGIDK